MIQSALQRWAKLRGKPGRQWVPSTLELGNSQVSGRLPGSLKA